MHGKLSYTPTHCKHCGFKNINYIIDKNGTQTSRITLPFIKHSLRYSYNNGRIEGINNKIKVLNRVAYGYRNFLHFKRRIFIHFTFQDIQSNVA
ncbi:transposase [Lederbergia galactosidilytica]|uniref:transposase n=1 Tax=Lederbergia galactosidilytica TaxID=217031 RepID=UPI0009EEB354|nr:transposase [Lederbergia galactosidilytica]